MISIIAAVARNGVIGKDGKMPWHIPDDLKYFKKVTMGGAIVMGRKTWDSIGRPLPGRMNIVLTRQLEWKADGVEVAHSLDEAVAIAQHREVFIIGGAEIYKLAMPLVDKQYITAIYEDFDGDAVFPQELYKPGPAEWELVSEEGHFDQKPPFAFMVMQRRGLEYPPPRGGIS